METKSELKSFFTEYWKYFAVNTACRLNLFDALEYPKATHELADSLNLNEKNLVNLLLALCNNDFLICTNGKFSLNEKSVLLTEQHPDSLKYACMNWANEHLTAWQDLDYSIKTGKSAFENLYHSNFFDYLNQHPEKLIAYHKAMYEYAKDDYRYLPDLIDFSKHKSIIDVGGGYGAAISIIKKKFPQIECYLFDLQKVIENSKTIDIQKISGSFFETIPSVAEAIILSRILHDWDDEKVGLILKNCFEALPEESILYVIENCSDRTNIDTSLLSLNMAVMCKSFERTFAEYETLCEQQGFKFQSDKQINQLQTILIFKKL